jgi:hypothetical protein
VMLGTRQSTRAVPITFLFAACMGGPVTHAQSL